MAIDDLMQNFKLKWDVKKEKKPCPFCGKTDALIVDTLADIEDNFESASDWDKTHYAVCCDATKGGCGAVVGKDCETPAEAIAAWNRRA